MQSPVALKAMMSKVIWPLAAVVLAAVLLGVIVHSPPARAWTLPERLADQEFWKLVTDSSEPGGYFRNSDITNLTSNEMLYEHVLSDLLKRVKPGGAYLGVGPEQNYTYIAALKPRIAIIFDIRRGNLDMQLMYKALFELSKDRADFVAMLFSKQRPSGLTPSVSATQLFDAFDRVPAVNETAFSRNLAAVEDRLTKTHALPLLRRDLDGIAEIYRNFYEAGFAVRPSPSYDDLMTATDERGAERSYLATEENYRFMKDLESRNLVVPVVGDFGGPMAIRTVAKYLKANGATVAAFYLSNVEQYLRQDGKWDAFCRNIAALPLDSSSTFIRSESGFAGSFRRVGPGFVSSLGQITSDIKPCAGR
ncbi:MAG TPA: hypothetical protein VGK48_19690 [Terriglobia bacterium]|jgi:hypothetical protein